MELYYPPFEGAVEAGVLSIMCSNNLVNGVYACANPAVEQQLLKNFSRFKGWVCSDYDGTRSAVEAANGGLDIAMPGPPMRPDYFNSLLRPEIANGAVSMATIDDKVTRVVYSLAAIGALDRGAPPAWKNATSNVTSSAHHALARKLASASALLLQNKDDILPLSTAASAAATAATASLAPPSAKDDTEKAARSSQRIALFGWAATDGSLFGGGGSGAVAPSQIISMWDELNSRPGVCGNSRCAFADGDDTKAAAAAAAAADVAIVVIYAYSHEGSDRRDLDMNQTDLVPVVAAANPNTIVVSVSPGPFITPWRDSVKAILDLGYPGEQGAAAAWDVIFGLSEPGGRLTHTMPNVFNETRYSVGQYPGTPPDTSGTGLPACTLHPVASAHFTKCAPYETTYSERLETGYRWYATHKVTPAFPFGHGLGYTKFSFADLHVDAASRNISFTLTNTGKRTGSAVPQLYVTLPSSAGENFPQLRGFTRISLAAGASQTVTFNLEDRWLSIWDDGAAHDWHIVKGTHQIMVGRSVSDPKALVGTLQV
eukprot:UC1_evm1s1974